MPSAEHRCRACRAPIPTGGVYHRVHVVIRGEQDLLPEAIPAESPGDLLARMEVEGDWDRYADDVHWERTVALCTACRDELRVFLEPGYRE
jgi:hypothetical protein